MKYNPANFADLAATDLGKDLWAFLTRPEHVLMMITASKVGRPAVEGVAEELFAEFGDTIKPDRVKQMIGHMIRQIVEAQGYRLASQGVPVRVGTVFNKASRYKRAA